MGVKDWIILVLCLALFSAVNYFVVNKDLRGKVQTQAGIINWINSQGKEKN